VKIQLEHAHNYNSHNRNKRLQREHELTIDWDQTYEENHSQEKAYGLHCPDLNSFLLNLLYTKHLVVKYINVKTKADRK